MKVLHPRCAGLDIHKDSVVACVRIAEGPRVVRHVQTFATPTADLERLSAWLKSHDITHVVMEATGVYWKPVWAVLCEEKERELAWPTRPTLRLCRAARATSTTRPGSPISWLTA